MNVNNQNFTTGVHILRVGLAITFIWIGVLIIKNPEAWGGYLQPWVLSLLPIPLSQVMFGTALMDILIGGLLLVDILTWVAALAASAHLIIVLSVSGITDVTVRDIGLLAGALTLFIESLPPFILQKLPWIKK